MSMSDCREVLGGSTQHYRVHICLFFTDRLGLNGSGLLHFSQLKQPAGVLRERNSAKAAPMPTADTKTIAPYIYSICIVGSIDISDPTADDMYS